MAKQNNGERFNKPLIREDYIQGMMTLKQIAEKHGLSLGTVHRWSKDERWDRLRKQYQRKEAERLHSEMLEKRHDSLIDFTLKVDETLNAIIGLVRNQIARIIKDEKDTHEEGLPYSLDPQELGQLTKILEMARQEKFKIYGVENIESIDKLGTRNLEGIPDLMRNQRMLPEWQPSKAEDNLDKKACELADAMNEIERRMQEYYHEV